MRSLEPRVQCRQPGGQRLDLQVPMQAGDDPQAGRSCRGHFRISGWVSSPRSRRLEISGRDRGPHHSGGRTHGGDEWDGQPATVAQADVNTPNFDWINSRRGSDTNHEVDLAVSEWDLTARGMTLLN